MTNLPEIELDNSPLDIGAYRFHLYKRPDGTYRSEAEAEPHGLYNTSASMGKPKWIASYSSKSRPGEKHDVYRYPDGTYICTCTGNLRYGYCWHVRKEKEKEKEEGNNLL